MESGAIADSQITASSQWDANHGWVNARLNLKIEGSKTGAWSAGRGDYKPWLQVDLLHVTTVKDVATQGRPQRSSQWVTSYKLQYSNDGKTFNDYKEEGQSAAKVITIFMCLVEQYVAGFIKY